MLDAALVSSLNPEQFPEWSDRVVVPVEPGGWDDVAASNLLVQSGRLAAVIDFGSCAIGDPACDLTLAWTFFTGSARRTFRAAMSLDDETWQRARGWALWKALILASGTAGTPDAARDAGVCSVSSSQKSEPSPIVPPPHMPPQWAGSHC